MSIVGKSGLAGLAILVLANLLAPAADNGLIEGRSGKGGHIGLSLRISLAGR